MGLPGNRLHGIGRAAVSGGYGLCAYKHMDEFNAIIIFVLIGPVLLLTALVLCVVQAVARRPRENREMRNRLVEGEYRRRTQAATGD